MTTALSEAIDILDCANSVLNEHLGFTGNSAYVEVQLKQILQISLREVLKKIFRQTILIRFHLNSYTVNIDKFKT